MLLKSFCTIFATEKHSRYGAFSDWLAFHHGCYREGGWHKVLSQCSLLQQGVVLRSWSRFLVCSSNTCSISDLRVRLVKFSQWQLVLGGVYSAQSTHIQGPSASTICSSLLYHQAVGGWFQSVPLLSAPSLLHLDIVPEDGLESVSEISQIAMKLVVLCVIKLLFELERALRRSCLYCQVSFFVQPSLSRDQTTFSKLNKFTLMVAMSALSRDCMTYLS